MSEQFTAPQPIPTEVRRYQGMDGGQEHLDEYYMNVGDQFDFAELNQEMLDDPQLADSCMIVALESGEWFVFNDRYMTTNRNITDPQKRVFNMSQSNPANLGKIEVGQPWDGPEGRTQSSVKALIKPSFIRNSEALVTDGAVSNIAIGQRILADVPKFFARDANAQAYGVR